MQTESQDTCSITKEKMPYRANLLISGYTELEIPESFDIDIKGNIICLTPKTLEKLIEPKFKDGDILVNKTGKPFILKAYLPKIDNVLSYCGLDNQNKFWGNSDNWTFASGCRFATEEEKQKLFDSIKENGYKWNAETKTLEKLKKEKFDISTLKPFDKVLVRIFHKEEWKADFFSHYTKDADHPFVTVGKHALCYCIPYENNEHLLGKTDDCDEYYKTWE